MGPADIYKGKISYSEAFIQAQNFKKCYKATKMNSRWAIPQGDILNWGPRLRYFKLRLKSEFHV